jgi:hypothetical protein
LVDNAPEGGQRLVEQREAEAMLDGNLAGERDGVKSEMAS